MNFKLSSFIKIFSFLSIILFSFYIFLDENISYFNNPILLIFLLISLLLLIIEELLNNIIFYQKLKFLSKKNKYKLLKNNNESFYKKLYKFLFSEYNTKNIEIINHNFDDITEYNNNLPNWWINLFYISIVISIIYFLAFLTTDFAHSDKEYNVAYKQHILEIKEYEKHMPQAKLATSIFKLENIHDGKILFEQICATCHNIDGGGNTGPNLTDEYWINKYKNNLYKNIFFIIWNGSNKNPTMRAFGKNGELKGNDIEKIASYVYFINQKKIKPKNAKKAQGEKFIWK